MDKESYRQGVEKGLSTAVVLVEQLATDLDASDKKAARWTRDIANYLRAAEVADMPPTAAH